MPARERRSKTPAADARLSRHNPVPMYRQLAERLAGLIDAGEWQPGQRLPSEPELMARYGVGRITVRQAIELVRQAGKISVHRGKGTYVTSRLVHHDLDALQGFYQSLRNQGIEPQTTLVEWKTEAGERSRDLAVSPHLPVRLRRLYAIDGKPFAVVTGHLPVAAAALGRAKVERLTVYEILSRFMETRIESAEVTIRCERAPGDIARLLGLPRSAMVLLMERQSFDQDGAPCEYMQIHIVPEQYEFRLRVKGPLELARAVQQVGVPMTKKEKEQP